MAENPWDPRLYARFRRERSQPFRDLLALVRPQPRMRVIDLGCGTGELTRLLHRSLHALETLGIDSSEAMLARSGAFRGKGLSFEKRDLSDLPSGSRYDLIFSNAALHWVPGHPRVLAHLAALLRPGGQIALQVPANADYPTHTVAAALAKEPPFDKALAGHACRWPVLAPEAYAGLLHRLGFPEQQVRLEVYAHLLPSRKDVVAWVKGSTLTGYERRMSQALYRRFLKAYRERLFEELEDSRPFLYPFKRILIWARR